MAVEAPRSPEQSSILVVLHPVFALTGICHSIVGPLLPSVALMFHLNDGQSGTLLFAYFAGTSLGTRPRAWLCALTCACLAVAVTNQTFLHLIYLFLGISVGMPMTAVSMYAGRIFGFRIAADFPIAAGKVFCASKPFL